ncbi:tyrosine-type recombinase/integrase [Klebsiella pneumoniae]
MLRSLTVRHYRAAAAAADNPHQIASDSRSDFLICAGIRKNSPDGKIHPDGLTKKFVTARKLSGLSCSDNPPTFHEIRSLSGRIYKAAYGKEFAQKLFGHKSEKMTEMYLNKRQKEYVMI